MFVRGQVMIVTKDVIDLTAKLVMSLCLALFPCALRACCCRGATRGPWRRRMFFPAQFRIFVSKELNHIVLYRQFLITIVV